MMAVIRATLAVLLLASVLSAQTIQFEDGAFKVKDWRSSTSSPLDRTEDLSSVFAVYTGGTDAPPVLGRYSIEGNALVFRPRFPLAAGVQYRAVFHPIGSAPVEASFDGPRKNLAPSTRIEHVYPSANVLPGNQLRLYIYFSAPMSLGEWRRRVHLFEQDGKAAEVPFLESADELWDPSYQRLTVFFDPGRIKRGLIPNEELGPPLVEGKQYTLVIDREFLDDRGAPLKEGFTKTFKVGPAIRKRLELNKWRITEPKAGTREPLIVRFPQMMDFALVGRLLRVPGIPGTVAVDRNETRWNYIPNETWKSGEYHIEVEPALEDVAGNRMDHVFDVDVAETPSGPIATEAVTLAFRVRP
jgi:hypothetical protein